MQSIQDALRRPLKKGHNRPFGGDVGRPTARPFMILKLPRFGGALIRRPSGYGLALTKARKNDTERRETP